MARRQKLKVFRTPTGFHDAYVAAPSRKAALAAWGSDVDLFAHGIAEVVTDEVLSREPLENPGKLIRRLRGTAEEQFAALGPDPATKQRPDSVGPKQRESDGGSAIAGRSEAVTSARPKRKGPGTGRGLPQRSEASKSRREVRPKPKPRPSRAKVDDAEKSLATLATRQAGEVKEVRRRLQALEKELRGLRAAHERARKVAERRVDRERSAHADRLDRWVAE